MFRYDFNYARNFMRAEAPAFRHLQTIQPNLDRRIALVDMDASPLSIWICGGSLGSWL